VTERLEMMIIKHFLVLAMILGFSSCTAQPTRFDDLTNRVRLCDADGVSLLYNESFDRLTHEEKTELIEIAIRTRFDCQKRLAVIKILLDRIQGVEIRSANGFSPIHLAASSGCNDILGFLLEQGFSVNDANPLSGITPLHIACANGLHESVKFLLDHGADSKVADFNGRVPMHSAVEIDEEMVRLLTSIDGSPIDIRDNFGLSPLFYLLMEDKDEDQLLSTIRVALRAKPDLTLPIQTVSTSDSTLGIRVKASVKPVAGDTVKSFALKRGFTRIAEFLDGVQSQLDHQH